MRLVQAARFTMMNFVIENAKQRDVDNIERIFRSAFDSYTQALGRQLSETAYDWLSEAIGDGTVWTVNRGGVLVGAISITPLDHTWSIDQVAVIPEMQGNGIGGLMLREVEAIARQRGIVRLELDTAKMMTGLVQLYQRNGFRVYREGLPAHGKDSHLRVFMEKVLLS